MINIKELFEEESNKIFKEMSEWYIHLHKNPESSFNEFKTSEYIYKKLESFGNISLTRLTDTSVVGVLKTGNKGKTVALRADIDALIMDEKADVPYVSEIDGVMHACGHDAHTSILLATAKILSEHKALFQGDIKFIFQHAEETPPGGAVQLIEKGVLDNVDYIFGLHVMPQFKTGSIALTNGTSFAASDQFDVNIQGRGGHAAMPENAIDPVVIAAEIVMALQTIVSRKISPFDSAVVSTTMLNTGSAYNIIPDIANIKGSVRTFDKDVRTKLANEIKQTFEGITATHNATCDFNYAYGYPVGKNNEDAFYISKEACLEFLDEENIILLDKPLSGSEDFTSYQEIVKGNFALLGIGREDESLSFAPHHPKFNVDLPALRYGVLLHLHTIANLMLKE